MAGETTKMTLVRRELSSVVEAEVGGRRRVEVGPFAFICACFLEMVVRPLLFES